MRSTVPLAMFCTFIFALAPVSKVDAQPDWAQDFVARWDVAARAATTARAAGQARARCADLIRDAVDVEALAAQTAAAFQAGPARRRALETATRLRLVSDCVRRRGEYGGAVISLLGVRETPSDVLVTADVSFSDRPSKRLVWRFGRPAGTRSKALDVVMQGRSLAADLRNTLTVLLRSHGGDLDRAIAALGSGP